MPGRLWFAVFAVWGLFLSGALASFGAGPGIKQSVRLNQLLKSRQLILTRLEGEMASLEAAAERLSTSRYAQEREIRRVLGYAREDEMIFDFTANEKAVIPGSQELALK